MRTCCGAVIALAVFGILLVGPLYVAISSADDYTRISARCHSEMGCETIGTGIAQAE